MTERKQGERLVLGILIIVLFVCFAPKHAWSKDKTGHVKDWEAVLGLKEKNEEGKANLDDLWKTTQNLIDKTSDVYQSEVKSRFKWFSFGTETHRILFHWGFNNDPKHHEPLEKHVRRRLRAHFDDATSKGHLLPDDFIRTETQAFYEKMKELQGKRNKQLIQKVTEVTGIPTSRGYANAVATIIYDVHMISDYTTTNISALPSIGRLEHDLLVNGFGRLLKTKDGIERLDQIERGIKQAVNVGRGRTNRVRAELLLETTAQYLPEILDQKFKHTLDKKGILTVLPTEQ